jgi:hypothetical protein
MAGQTPRKTPRLRRDSVVVPRLSTDSISRRGVTPKQVSRLWLNRYARPRTERGTFAPGYCWTRPDGQSRYLVDLDPIGDDCARAL